MTTTLIQTSDALAEHVERWSRAPWLAVDTEFVRVDTYYPKLCLIQVSDGQLTACIDVLAFADLSPVLQLLCNEAIVKVLHAAAQDYEIFVRACGICPRPLFDTQVAATLLGIGDQIGYGALMELRRGIKLDKSLARTDWARRPLTEAELAYAAADVAELAAAFPALQRELHERDRLGWLAEDCARLCEPSLYRTDPHEAWQRLKGLARLSPVEQRAAAALAQWREQEAQGRDRPRRWIVEDDVIYRLAQRRPQSVQQLEALNVLPPRTLARHGERLVALLAGLPDEPPEPLASDDTLTPEHKQRLARMMEEVKKLSAEIGVPASFIAPRADLVSLVLRGPAAGIPLLSGWRHRVAGERLLALL